MEQLADLIRKKFSITDNTRFHEIYTDSYKITIMVPVVTTAEYRIFDYPVEIGEFQKETIALTLNFELCGYGVRMGYGPISDTIFYHIKYRPKQEMFEFAEVDYVEEYLKQIRKQ